MLTISLVCNTRGTFYQRLDGIRIRGVGEDSDGVNTELPSSNGTTS